MKTFAAYRVLTYKIFVLFFIDFFPSVDIGFLSLSSTIRYIGTHECNRYNSFVRPITQCTLFDFQVRTISTNENVFFYISIFVTMPFDDGKIYKRCIPLRKKKFYFFGHFTEPDNLTHHLRPYSNVIYQDLSYPKKKLLLYDSHQIDTVVKARCEHDNIHLLEKFKTVTSIHFFTCCSTTI